MAAIFGFFTFVARTDWTVLDPRRVDVLMPRDLAFHAAARNFAQWDSWHWPLARIDNYLHPVGTSAVYTDANPWLTLVTKALLPGDAPAIQLIGVWLASCFALQGFVGARWVASLGQGEIISAIGGMFFVLSPALTARIEHDTLAAHWLVCIALALAVAGGGRPDRRAAIRRLAACAVVTSIAAGLHPTLLAMIIPLAAVVVTRDARGGGRGAWMVAGAVVLCPALVLIAFGTLNAGVETETIDFGKFSANLLAFIDPYTPGGSAIFPPLAHDEHQREGFAYLGAGAITALAIGALAAIRVRALPPRTQWATWTVCGLLFAYALSSRVMWGSRVVVDLSILYAPFHAVTNAFRSSGRFLWPLYYLLLFTGIRGVCLLPARARLPTLLALLALQVFDLHRMNARSYFALGAPPAPPAPPSDVWRRARGRYRHLVLDPPDIETNDFRCDGADYEGRYFLQFVPAALAAQVTLNSGQAARINRSRFRAYCDHVARARRDGNFAKDTIYAPSPELLAEYRARRELVCGSIDGRFFCVRGDSDSELASVLRDAS